MAYTTIDKPSDYFNTKLYTGTGSSHAITGVGFSPNWVWIKKRSATGAHGLLDTVRGVHKSLATNSTGGTNDDSNSLTAFGSDGFTVGSSGAFNGSSATFVSWNWKKTATAGFDIVSFTGSGSQRTVSHNLGVKPSMIIVKNRSATENWIVYDKINGAGKFMALNLTSASAASSSMFGVEPTTSVFTVGTSNATNKSSSNMIAYCFAEKQGYSKIGSYVGNGNANGAFVYTGFKPAFVLLKYSSAAGNNWFLYDNKRPGYNEIDQKLYANASDVEEDSQYNNMDFLSNGFKLRTTDGDSNASGGIYIFMAFAENPFVTSSGVPATAR